MLHPEIRSLFHSPAAISGVACGVAPAIYEEYMGAQRNNPALTRLGYSVSCMLFNQFKRSTAPSGSVVVQAGQANQYATQPLPASQVLGRLRKSYEVLGSPRKS